MIEIARVDHLSMVVPDLDRQVELLERLFGFRYAGTFAAPGYIGVDMEIPGRTGVSWEILAPDGSDSYLHRFLGGRRGPGLHHIGLEVQNIDQALSGLAELGLEPWGLERSGGGEGPDRDGPEETVFYIHPRSGGFGLLYEIHAGEPWHLPEPFLEDGPDTLGIVAVHSVGHANHAGGKLGDWYERLFGMRTLEVVGPQRARASFSLRLLELPCEQLRIEVMEPARADSFLKRFLAERGPGIHHVSFEVADIERALAACRRRGVDVFARQSGRSGERIWHEFFIGPGQTGGMLVQCFAWVPVEAAAIPPEPAVRAESDAD